MADEKKIGTPEDESNIDQINSLITSSDDADANTAKAGDKEEDFAVVTPIKAKDSLDIEEKKIEQASAKKVAKPKPVEHKPIMEHSKKPQVHQQQEIKRQPEKKIQEKPQEKKIEQKDNGKIEHKHTIKSAVKTVVKSEHKNNKNDDIKQAARSVKEKPKAKKSIIIRKPLREDKMAEHKEHKDRSSKKKFKFSKNTLLWVGIGILGAILIIAMVFILTTGKGKTPVITNQTSNVVAATVNGENIYLQDITNEYNNLNPAVKAMYSIESLLNKSIDDILLYQDAKTQGITVTADETQAEIDSIKTQNQLTDTTLEAALKNQNMTLDGLKVVIEKNLVIRKLLNETVLKGIVVTPSEVESYYTQNIDKFKVPEKVTVQHILVLISPNVTDAMAKAKIDMIQSTLNSTNFCDLVTKYSDDSGSVGNCGKYTFARGDFGNPTFENPSFSMAVNETTIVKANLTTYSGYHLIKKLAVIPSSVMNLSSVYDEINTTVHDQDAQKKFDTMMETLRTKATIINYVSKTNNNSTVITTVQNLDDFAKCITSKGAVFYGASWCPHCNNQKELFGNSLQYVKYVECADANNPQVQTPECTAAGISGYPTWTINNQSYPGEQTISGLAKLTGCSAPQ